MGRSPLCDICIDRPTLSRRHARLRIGPPLSVEDLGSINGTRLRGEPVRPGEPQPVSPGDVIDFGSLSGMVQIRTRAPRGRRLLSHAHFEALLEEECQDDGTDAQSLLAAAAARAEHSEPPARTASAVELLRAAVRDEQRQRIVDALARCAGNQTLAAKLLGISRRRLLFLLDRHDLPRPRKRGID